MFSKENFQYGETIPLEFEIYKEAKEIIGNDVDCTDLLAVISAFGKKALDFTGKVNVYNGARCLSIMALKKAFNIMLSPENMLSKEAKNLRNYFSTEQELSSMDNKLFNSCKLELSKEIQKYLNSSNAKSKPERIKKISEYCYKKIESFQKFYGKHGEGLSKIVLAKAVEIDKKRSHNSKSIKNYGDRIIEHIFRGGVNLSINNPLRIEQEILNKNDEDFIKDVKNRIFKRSPDINIGHIVIMNAKEPQQEFTSVTFLSQN